MDLNVSLYNPLLASHKKPNLMLSCVELWVVLDNMDDKEENQAVEEVTPDQENAVATGSSNGSLPDNVVRFWVI